MLTGQVRIADTTLTEGTVILHGVSPNESGEVDSTSVDTQGRFRFDLPRVPDSGGGGQIYFASIRHEGILYFGPAIAQPDQLDSTYVVQVYGVQVAPIDGAQLAISTRNLFFEIDDGGGWRATDLFEIRNDLDRTLVADDEGMVWSYPLPAGATDFQLGDATALPDNAVTFVDGRIELRAPLPPGERVFVARYAIPAPPLEIPMPGVTETMEFLVREPAPALDVDGLEPVALVSIEPGSSYRRYSGTDIESIDVRVDDAEDQGVLPPEWLTAILLAVLGGAGLFAIYRPNKRVAALIQEQPSSTSVADTSPASATRESLILDIARLDARLDELDDPVEAERLQMERARLLTMIKSMS